VIEKKLAKKTFDAWLEEFTAVDRKMLANKDNASAIGGYKYKGTIIDSEWGEVHVFERSGTAQDSDLYYGKPMVEIMKIDTVQPRFIEITKIVLADDKNIVHSSYRLVRWEIIDETQAPENVFEIK
jgi:hypothetical protein